MKILLAVIALLLVVLLYVNASRTEKRFELHPVETDNGRELVGFDTHTGRVCTPFDATPSYLTDGHSPKAVDRCRDIK